MAREAGAAARAGPGKSKRADLVAGEIKRLITERNLRPGDRLPRETELQQLFAVSKSTMREALKSLEVQGLVTISTGPAGGGRIVEVTLDRTFQLLQNYLFFKEVTIDDIYTARKLLEPELAAGAVPYLTDADFHALEHSIECCDPASGKTDDVVAQRKEDLNFHDILALANPNPFLRFLCQLINAMLRQLTVFENDTPVRTQRRFGQANVRLHQAILAAARAGDANTVRELMAKHMAEASGFVKKLNGKLQGRLILDSEMSRRDGATGRALSRDAGRKVASRKTADRRTARRSDP
ncbi:FadR/GntR family transcriptional regulator [Bordetella genomosp. 9]|uniref:GntR family transcriptional regulator n=1 Tax=Bordetella genomosp. 9 TaxID=1416803 RepID=A0A1W6YWM5_9BORD|nr:FCD domain-containing protein [Bordetella genomosp. 9]ARP85480.1 GntR family transcriptional regulator [Bordetella genomosp. 9]